MPVEEVPTEVSKTPDKGSDDEVVAEKRVTPSTEVPPDASPTENPSKPTDVAEPAAQNQKQNIPADKATLGNSLNNFSALPLPEPSTDLSQKPKSKDGRDKVPRKERLVNRLKDNKVALLTSEAMAQMGCNGFVTKQKEVISQACSLL